MAILVTHAPVWTSYIEDALITDHQWRSDVQLEASRDAKLLAMVSLILTPLRRM